MQDFSKFIWAMKYQLKDKYGNPVDLTISDNKDRVAKALAVNEQDHVLWEKKFRDALDFALGAGRIMSNAGAGEHKSAVSLINCNVSGTLDDSMESIFERLREAALTLKAGCVYKDTQVITEHGQVAVQEAVAQKHELILAYDRWTRVFEFKKILKHKQVVVSRDANITVHAQGVRLTTSKIHPILVYRQGFKIPQYLAANEIRLGDFLIQYPQQVLAQVSNDQQDLAFNDLLVRVTEIETNCDISDEFYDFEVEDHHNYCAGYNGLVVTHNCGIGYHFGTLRPKGSFVQGSGSTTSGPISFMDVFDRMCKTIMSAGGRRGAQMGTLDVSHPDIIDFIRAKREDGKLREFNLSVLINDEFIHAVKNDLPWHLVWKDEINREIRALDLWDIIMDSAYNWAEPGFLLIDRINKYNNLWFKESLLATNPCVSGDTKILTLNGYKRIDSLVDQEVTIWNGNRWSTVTPQVTGHNQDLIDLEFSDGSRLSCTKYHRFILADGKKVEAKRLLLGSKLMRHSFPVIAGTKKIKTKVAYTQGFYAGNGQKNTKAIWLYEEKCKLLPYLSLSTYSDQSASSSSGSHRLMASMKHKPKPKDFVPSAKYTIQTRLDWLAGLLDADGTVDQSGSVQLWSIDRDFLQNVKYLLNTLGANGVLTCGTAAGKKRMPDGKGSSQDYTIQEAYRLDILASQVAYLRELGLTTHCLDISYNPNGSQDPYIKVVGISYRAKPAAKVYCFNEPHDHTGVFNGVMTGQCGEQALGPFGSCFTGSMYLETNYGRITAKQAFKNYQTTGDLQILVDARFTKTVTELRPCHMVKREGKRQVLKIETQHGRILKFTPDHLFSTPNGWVKAEQLKVGDYLHVKDNAMDVVKAITWLKKLKTVYDIEEPTTNTLVVEDIVVHNCLLGSVMLHKFVEQPFTNRARFNQEKFREIVAVFTRMLDNVVELAGLPLPQQNHELSLTRRHGMGYMGLGTTLTMLGYRYGNPESLKFTDYVTKELAMTGFEAGVELAKEKGMAPALERRYYVEEVRHQAKLNKNTNFDGGQSTVGKDLLVLSHYFDLWRDDSRGQQILRDIERYGSRFSHHSSLAPTGCTLSSTKILTQAGIKTYQEILTANAIDWQQIEQGNVKCWYPLQSFALPSQAYAPDLSDKIWYNGHAEVLKLTFEDQTTFTCTKNHKLLVLVDRDYVWVEADYLHHGDQVVAYRPDLTLVQIIDVEEQGQQPTWDIEVQKNHCYLLANGVLSHNTIAASFGENCCLAQGTLIDTDHGQLPIEAVTTDMKVLNFDVVAHRFDYLPITFAGLTRPQTEVYEVELVDGKTVRATADHKFLVKEPDGNLHYVAVQDLTPDHHIVVVN